RPLKKGRAAQARPPLIPNFFSEWLCRLHVLGLPALGTLHYIELDLLAFLKAAESSRLDRREVNENVLAILAADKTISLCVVKPLYCSCFHGIAYVPFIVVLRESLAGLSQAGSCCRAEMLLVLQNKPQDQTQADCTSIVMSK